MGNWVGATVTPYGSASGATAVINRPAITYLAGDVIVLGLSEQGTITGTNPITTDAGVVRMGGANALGDRAVGLFRYVVTDPANVPATFTFGGFGSGRGVGFAMVRRGVDIEHLVNTSPPYSVTDLAAFTTEGPAPYVYIGMWTDQRTTPRSHAPSVKPAMTELANIQNTLDNSTAGSRTAIWVGYIEVPAGGPLSQTAKSLTWPDGVSANRAVSAVLRDLPASTGPIGVPVKEGNGAAAKLSYLDGGGTRKAPTRAAIWLPGHADVEAFLAKAGATASHRGGSLVNPEYAEISYDRCVYRRFDPLEISLGWTSDLVPFGLGDETLDRAAGVSGGILPTAMDWATLSSTYRNVLRPVAAGVTQPFYRLEEMLAKYAPHQVVMVDPKFGFNTPTKVARMLEICDALGGPDRIIVKFDSPVASTLLVDQAKLKGYITMNYWGTEVEKLTTQYGVDRWDLLGIRYDADQASYDTINGFGKPVWAAVIPDQAGYNTALARGADLMMIANPNVVTPVR
ncbi:phosphoesterase [Microbacterium phage SallyK]|nr:phosphoesterase [Microbacterium phage SallyK]